MLLYVVVQRLNDFRVPVNTDIQMRFSRRVKINEEEEEEVQPSTFDNPQDESNANANSGGWYNDEAHEHASSDAPNHTPTAQTGGLNDIDEDEYIPSPSKFNSDASQPQFVPQQNNDIGDINNIDEDEDHVNSAPKQGLSEEELADEEVVDLKYKVSIISKFYHIVGVSKCRRNL